MTETNNTVPKGKVSSLETFGLVDGPGVRFVVFLQGCRMRCRYCHNPETWEIHGGEPVTASQVLDHALRYRGYWGKKGGITVSGGEPLLQIDFVTELFEQAKARGIHTCLDTAGNPFARQNPFFKKMEKLIRVTDLFLLDLKEMNEAIHRQLTGWTNRNILELALWLSENGKKMWIRHVLFSGTDDDASLRSLRAFIGTLSSVEKVQVLPYHTLGKEKYEKLGIPYPLTEAPPSAERVENAKIILTEVSQ